MAGEAICWAELHNCVDDPIFSFRILQIKLEAFIHDFVYFLNFFGISCVKTGSYFTQYPHSNSDDKICGDAFDQQIFHLSDDLLTKLMGFLVILYNQSQEVVQNTRR